MSVDWSFRFRDTPSEESPVRWGHMAVAKDFADVTADKINLLVSMTLQLFCKNYGVDVSATG
jgi:hypothetical protein